MDRFKEYKRALGSRAEEMTEEQIRQLMALHDRLAGAIFDLWVRELDEGETPSN